MPCLSLPWECPDGPGFGLLVLTKMFIKRQNPHVWMSFTLGYQTVNIMVNRVYRSCLILGCGAKYLVKLSNHLSDVHQLDHMERRNYLQEAKLQPKVKVIIYQDAQLKRFKTLKSKRSRKDLTPSRRVDIFYQPSTPRKVKGSHPSNKVRRLNVVKSKKRVSTTRHQRCCHCVWKTSGSLLFDWERNMFEGLNFLLSICEQL